MTRTTRLVLATATALMIALPMGGAIAQAAPPPPAATAATTVTVKAGDSLSGLAVRFGVRLSALLRANSMTLTSLIRPGDTLVIPAGSTAPVPAPALPAPTSPAATTVVAPAPAAGPTTTYVVKSGDALAGIARLNGVKLGALLKANGLKTTSVIVPGQTLKVPPATLPIPTPQVTAPTTQAPAAPATPVQAIANVTTPAAASAAASATPGGSLDTVLTFLRAQIGVPYAFFRAGPDAYDCSGLVVAAFRQVGLNLPHQSRALAQRGSAVDWTTTPISAGDLVFTSAVGDPSMITHVGIALDATTWIHAVGVGRSVSTGPLPPASKIMAVRRITLP